MIGLPLAAALLLAAPHREPSYAPARCQIIYMPWVRPDSGGHVVLRMRSDSVMAGRWPAAPGRAVAVALFEYPSLAADSVRRTYHAQRADVVSMDTAWARRRLPPGTATVALFHWMPGPGCGPAPDTASATRFPAGTVVVLATDGAAVRAEGGVPVLFEQHSSVVGAYVPAWLAPSQPRQWWRLGRRRPVLSADEYVGFLQAMPTWSTWNADPRSASQALERWAAAHPALATREPARSALAAMRRIGAIEAH